MKIGFLGAGHLGGAIIEGLLNSQKYQKQDFQIVIANDKSLANYQEKGFQVSKDWNSLKDCHVIILALRPNDINDTKEKLATTFNQEKIIISVAAGISLAKLQEMLPNCLITRVMPNTSCQFNQSMTMITKEGETSANQAAEAIFDLVGKTIVLSETKIHVFITICGSANAYLYYWLEPLMQLALKSDISLADNKTIIAGLLNGVAANIQHSTDSLEALWQAVAVPNGTTIEAIKVFDQENLQETITNAIQAVKKRSENL